MAFLSRMFNKKRMSEEMIVACREGSVDVVRRLIERGEDVNAVGWYGETALHRASYRGHVDTVSLLLAAGADVHAFDRQKRHTALDLARIYRRQDVVNVLLAHLDKVNVHSQKKAIVQQTAGATAAVTAGATAAVTAGATSAVTTGSTAAVTAGATAVTAGAKANLKEEKSKSVKVSNKRMSEELLEACKDGREDNVRRLIERGEDVNAVDWYGDTALHYASFYGQVDTVRLLLTAGVDVHAVNKFGDTALDDARSKGHQDVVNVLQAHLDKVNVHSQKKVIAQQTAGATAAVSAGATAAVSAGATAVVAAGATAAVTAGETAGATAAVTEAKLKSVKVSNKQPVDIVKPPVEREDDIGVLTQNEDIVQDLQAVKIDVKDKIKHFNKLDVKNKKGTTWNRGRLPKADFRTLQEFHVRLMTDLVPDRLIDHLFQRGVIDDDELDVIKKRLERGRAEGVGKMLQILHFSGRDAFRLFLECLEQEKVGYKDLADELKYHRYTRVQPDIKTLQHFHDRLKTNVVPIPLIDHLFQKNVINLDEMDIIKKALEKGRVVGMDKLLEILHFSRADDFDLFLECLVNVGYVELASELREHRY